MLETNDRDFFADFVGAAADAANTPATARRRDEDESTENFSAKLRGVFVGLRGRWARGHGANSMQAAQWIDREQRARSPASATWQQQESGWGRGPPGEDAGEDAVCGIVSAERSE